MLSNVYSNYRYDFAFLGYGGSSLIGSALLAEYPNYTKNKLISMNNNKILIATGGTGGHVFPGCNLAKHLLKKIRGNPTTDERGYKFVDSFKV